MDYYFEVKILAIPEISSSHIMNSLFDALHLALVRLRYRDVGVSFPEVNGKDLGACLRIHGTEESLRNLLVDDWWRGMHDYIEILPVGRVPHDAKFKKVQRVQTKSSPERLRRRLERRQGIPPEEAKKKIPDSVAKKLDLPYLKISSKSSGQNFRLFIRHGPTMEKVQVGSFNSYGLSMGGSIPWF
jgi:CRISPR-associated endonuclease Csy4